MKVAVLQKAIKIVSKDPILLSPQAKTYLRTYPALLSAASKLPRDPTNLLYQISTIAYGWMPRIVRLDRLHIKTATSAIKLALEVSLPLQEPTVVKQLAACLHSVVGASKVLHFLKPTVFPIWDSKVARIWEGNAHQPAGMTDANNYLKYAGEVHSLLAGNAFQPFHYSFQVAYGDRLQRLGIRRYKIGGVRSIEAAAFELAGGDYDDAATD